jgi:hypothetical protein
MKMPPLTVACPCGTEVEIPVYCTLKRDNEGRQLLNFDPDYADLWAHAWTHDITVDFELEDGTSDA